MQQSDIGREIVVIISDTETIKGVVVSVTDEFILGFGEVKQVK